MTPLQQTTALTKSIAKMNLWREQFNPLRGLTIARAVALMEAWQRGEMADYQWTCFFVEQTDPDLIALIARRTSALEEMDWQIKIVAPEKAGAKFNEALAVQQAQVLRDAYEAIDNLYEAIAFLELAAFRGYSHLEKWNATQLAAARATSLAAGAAPASMPSAEDDGRIVHLEPVNQWNVVRDGMFGPFKYNPQGLSLGYAGVPTEPLPADRFLCRHAWPHINRIALLKFIRANLCEKDWDAFVEIYGVPGGVVIMPPNIPQGKETEYRDAAEDIAGGGSGALPNGADYKANDSPRGTNPFRDRLDHLSQKLVLAGTGGLLTMLTESGSGTLAGAAHTETFKSIARGEARKISEVLQKQFDTPLLDAQFPGEPHLAYFDLNAREQIDSSKAVTEIAALAAAGFVLDPEQVTEKTSWKVTPKPITADTGFNGQRPTFNARRSTSPLRNAAGNADHSSLVTRHFPSLARAAAADFAPLRAAIENILALPETEFRAAIDDLKNRAPQLLKQMNAGPALAAEIEKFLGTALVEGLAGDNQPPEKKP